MRTIFAAFLAAIIAYVFNSIIIRKIGISVLTDVVPIFEESIKTCFAVFMRVQIQWVHILFGLIEGFSDFQAGEHLAAFLSVISHTLFGIIAYIAYRYYGLWWSLVISSACHIMYNRWMLSKSN